MLKNPFWSGQIGCLNGPICDGQGDEVGDGAEDRVVYFSEEEYSATMACQLWSGSWIQRKGRRCKITNPNVSKLGEGR
jgi:hypothetical protein